MEKRYQVFVSSTFEDLKEERAAVIKCLLDNNCIPVGMEQFPSSNMSQWEYIKKMMEYTDYVVLITAGKYGTIDTNSGKNLSYTEEEYDYALDVVCHAKYKKLTSKIQKKSRRKRRERRLNCYENGFIKPNTKDV